MRPAAMAGLHNPAASGLGFLSHETDDHPRTRASLGRWRGSEAVGWERGWLAHSFLLSFSRFPPRPCSGPEGMRPCAGWPLGPLSGGCSAPGRGGPRKTPTQSVPSLITPWEGAGPPLPLSPCLAGEEGGGHRERASLHLGVLSPPGRWGSRATSPPSCSGPAGARETLLTRGWPHQAPQGQTLLSPLVMGSSPPHTHSFLMD